MDRYLFVLDSDNGSAYAQTKLSSNKTKIKILEDDNALILLDGYFLNKDSFIKKNSVKPENNFEELLFSLSKKNIAYEKELEGSYNIIFFNKKNNYFKFINDFWASRPTYCYKNKAINYFSNDLNFLKKEADIKVTPNIKKIKELLAWQHIDNSTTFYNEIDNVRAGSVLEISNFSTKHKHINIFDKQKRFKKFDENSFKKIFELAVQKRSSKFENILVMLSGGLDSSAVTVALKNNSSKNVETISANFSHIPDSLGTDETKYQNYVSNFTKFRKSNIEMKHMSVLGDVEKYVHIFQEPVILPNLYIFEQICKRLQQSNIDAIFDGNDGDNVISYGFNSIFQNFISMRFYSFYKSVSSYAELHNKPIRKMLNFFLKNSIKKLLKYEGRVINNTLLHQNIFNKVKRNSTRNILDSHESNLRNNLHHIAFNNRHKIFSRLGVEPVSPFYDKDLIDFCTQMPSKFKFNNGYTRYILRDYLSKYLPKEHAFRISKSNLAYGLESNFSELDIKIVMEQRKSINKRLINLIEITKIDEICNEWQKNKKISEGDIINLQIFLNVNIFLNSFFD